MKILEFVKREVERRTGTTVEMSIVRNSFFFVLSSALGRKRFVIKKPDSDLVRYTNFFGVTFANQGYGKDTSLAVCEEMFSNVLESYLPTIIKEFNQLTATTPMGDVIDSDNVIVPKNYKVPLRGSIEGMMRVGNFFNNTTTGSLNVVSTEFGHEITADTLSVLMKLWQDGKSDGSTNVNEKYPPINDVPTNILLFGSPEPFRRTKAKHALLVEMISSGLGRRSNFSWTDFTPMERINHGETEAPILKEYTAEIGAMLSEMKSNVILLTPEAVIEVEQFMEAKINEYNLDRSSLNNIFARMIDSLERTSALVAIANLNKKITAEDVKETISIIEESMSALRKVLIPPSAHKIIFEVSLARNDFVSIFDVEEHGVIFVNKQEMTYQLELLEEYTQFKGMRLISKGKRFKVEPLPVTDLSKIIVSISTIKMKNPEKATNFAPREYPFLGEYPSIEALVSTSEIESFCLSHFKPSGTAPDGHRKLENHIQGQNMIAFDIDDGFTIKEAQKLLEPYTYLIYTTRSHQKEKNNKIVDRFRILIPTKTIFYVDPEQHKQLYENISEILEIPIYDVATRNVSRLWFTNPDAEIFKNDGEFFDVYCCMPDTERAVFVLPALNNLQPEDDSPEARRILGMKKFIIMNLAPGNRDIMLMRWTKYLVDIAHPNIGNEVREVNSLLGGDALPEKEVFKILRKNHVE